MSDIVCEDIEVVTVLCNRMDVKASDLVLDSPARRKPNGPKFRRALVHDESDGLSINFANDYPGGVSIAGDIVTVACKRMDVRGSDLILDSPVRRKPNGPKFRRALVHDESDGLSINFNNDYPGGVSIAGDIVTVACKRMDVRGSDLILDSPARRKPNGPNFRRALVHDESDGLTINFNNDYPGGVTVGGDVITMACKRMDVTGSDIVLDSPVRRKAGGPKFRRALVHDENDGLSINFGNDYPGGVTMGDVRVIDVTGDLHFRVAPAEEGAETETVILGDVIKTLRAQITDLQAQVAELAARP